MTLYELVLLLNGYLVANVEISFTSLINTLNGMYDVVSYDVENNLEVESIYNPWEHEPLVKGAIIRTITVCSNTEHNYIIKMKGNSILSVERVMNISYMANSYEVNIVGENALDPYLRMDLNLL